MKKILKLSMLSSGIALGIMASSGAVAQGACSVNFSLNSWGAGGQATVAVTNNGAAASGWELCWTYEGNDKITNLWDGVVSQTGKNVCVTNPSYNPNLGAGAIAQFGFILENPGAVPTSFTFNGVSCGGTAASSSVVASSSSAPVVVPPSSSSSSVAPAPSGGAAWLLNAADSSFTFVTVKKSLAGSESPEHMTFNELKGTVSSTGEATLSIPLETINSGVPIRNTRMQEKLFEVQYLPELHFTTKLDATLFSSMAVGSTQIKSMTGTLILHGVTKSITFDAFIVKHANNSVSVSPRKPIVVNAADFDLTAGVAALQGLAGLGAIGEKVPVYFKMLLTSNNPNNTPAITLAQAPSTPTGLTGTTLSNGVMLNWADTSTTESGFLVRRKGADGRWVTATSLLANNVYYLDALTEAGSYDFKVISFKDSIPSAPTSALTVAFNPSTGGGSTSSANDGGNSGSPQTSSSSSSSAGGGTGGDIVGDATRGADLWVQQSCVACHGVDGERNANGTFALNPVNPNREWYRHGNDTEARSLRDFIAMWMPQGSGGTCVGQCAADLEAYIRTWRRPSDGIPDTPVSVFSCPSNAQSYGQRTLRLLTRAEYQRSVRDLVNYQTDVVSTLPDDNIAGAFFNNSSLVVDRTRYTSYLAHAERIAADAATRWNAVLGCTPSANCATTLVDSLGERIFRRPLTTDERTAYLAVANGTTGNRPVAEGMEVALAAMLSSPQFLYRSEIGELSSNGVYKLTGYEMATYLSYTYTGSTPSASLLQAAKNGSLNTAEGVRTQAAALLSSSNTPLLLTDLVNRWINTEKLEGYGKTLVDNFPVLAEDMKKELGKNFANAMLKSGGTFADLYSPTTTHVNSRLAQLYGVPFSGQQDADGFVRVNTSDRGGILLSGAFLSRYASATDSNMITRAVALRRKLMCQDIPEPPSGVSLDREALAARDAAFYANPTTTQRMIFDRITSGTTCSNCHGEIINPLGGGMEDYDSLGRQRTTDAKGNPIDSKGTFFSPYPQLQFLNDPDRVLFTPEIKFNGAVDLARTIIEQPEVNNLAQTCLATQFVSYTSGINSIFLIDSDRDVGVKRISKAEEDAYRCDIADLTSVLNTRGPRAMLETLPTLDSVMYRKEWAR